MHFAVSGVDCSPLLPPLVAFLISVFTTSAGVSGAFLILPFQMSVLGFVSPAVTPTNLLYNVVAIPGGVFRYIREGRMNWALAATVISGTLPGLFAGAVIRVRYLPDPRAIKFFVGMVLLYLGARLLYEGARWRKRSGGLPEGAVMRTKSISWSRIEYDFLHDTFAFKPTRVVALALAVGLVGGIYGIGGGAIIAPFLVTIMGLPVYTVAGAALFGTFVSSISGVAIFGLIGLTSLGAHTPTGPDWALGALFGVGGLFGTYFGARLQKHLPERGIRLFLGALITTLALYYVGQFLAA